MRKSKILTLLFALCPGTGHMYLGQMKKGVLFLTLFWGVIGLAGFFYLVPLTILLPVIWFYSFFDVLNLYPLTPEQREIQEHAFLAEFSHFFAGDNFQKLLEKRGLILGAGLILVGGYLLLRTLFSPLIYSLAHYFPALYNLIYDMPTILVAILLLFFGFKLVRGKKPASDQIDDLKEYKGHDE